MSKRRRDSLPDYFRQVRPRTQAYNNAVSLSNEVYAPRISANTMAYGRTRGKTYKSKRRSRSRKRRPIRRRTRIKRPRSNINNKRKALLRILTVPNYWNAQEAYQAVVPAPTAATGKSIIYEAPDHSTPRVIDLQAIANVITPAPTHASLKYHLTKVTARYEYSNMSLATTYLTAYFCKVRHNIPDLSGSYSPLIVLGDGFAANNYNNTGTSRGQLGLTDSELTPFQSSRFCSLFKIYKVKKLKLQGGESGRLTVKQPRMWTLNMDDIVTQTNVATMTTFPLMARYYSHLKGARFILWRIEGEVTNNDAVKTQITNTSPTVNFITHYHYEFKWMSDTHSNIYTQAAVGFSNPVAPEIITEQGQTDIP